MKLDIGILVPGLFTVVAVAALAVWIDTGSRSDIELRVPGLDEVPEEPAKEDREPVLPFESPPEPVPGPGKPSAITTAWPGFRGPDRDGICKDGVKLAREWPEGGPPVLWSLDLGEGYAAAAVTDGCVYVLDYDAAAQQDVLRCVSLDDGQEVWRNGYHAEVARSHGMSRTIPAIDGEKVVTIGPLCQVACWNTKTGELNWFIDMPQQFSAVVPEWYAGQCPLIDNGRVIIAPGVDALAAAIDLESGDVIWKTPNPREWLQTHASIMPMEFAGRRMFIVVGTGGVAGVDAETGKLLWDTTDFRMQMATSPSPVVLPGGRILCSCGYNPTVGAIVLQVYEDGDELRVRTLERFSPRQFNSEQQTPILHEGYLYGVRKRGGGPLVCFDVSDDKLKEVYNSGSARFGHGPYLIADGLIYLMDNKGKLTMAEATPDGYRQLAQQDVFEDGSSAWGPMALVEGRLIVRDIVRMKCLDVRE